MRDGVMGNTPRFERGESRFEALSRNQMADSVIGNTPLSERGNSWFEAKSASQRVGSRNGATPGCKPDELRAHGRFDPCPTHQILESVRMSVRRERLLTVSGESQQRFNSSTLRHGSLGEYGLCRRS